MAIRFLCECGKHLSAADELAGRRVKCPGCKRVLIVPSGTGDDAAQPGPAAAPPVPPAPSPAAAPPLPPTSSVPPPAPAPGLWAPRARRARSPSYRGDEALRSRNILWLGIALLVGFLLPIVIPFGGEVKVIFPNFLVLGEADAPFLVKFMCLYPGLAGIAVMLMAYGWGGVGRSITLMGLGLLPIALLMTDRDVQRGLGEMARVWGALGGAAALLGLFGIMGVFAGSRARSFCPGSRSAAVVGAAGAGLYLLSLVIPTQMPGLRRSSTTIGLIQPFELLGIQELATLGIAQIVSMALVIAASILCLLNAREGGNAEPLARHAFRLLVGGFLISFVAGMFFGMTAGGGLPGEAIVPVVFLLLKMVCWVMGILLLTPVGLTDLLVNTSSAGSAIGGGEDPARRIARFQKLLDEGLITPEEFEKKRRDILSGM